MNKNLSVNERTRILLMEIDCEIKRLQDTLRYVDPSTENYKDIMENLKQLVESKQILNKIELEETNAKKIQLDPNTVFSAGAMLVVTLAILKYEKLNTITSKAFAFIPRLLRHV